MATYEEQRSRPQARLNKAGWRVVTVSSVLLTVSLVAALIAQTSFPGSQKEESPDGLTTLTLVLAVLAFLVQIVVFMYQSVENAQTVGRAEDLHLRTQTALEAIKTRSDATQQVLTSQFSRVLDHALSGRPRSTELAGDASEDGDAVGSQVQPVARTAFEASWENALADLRQPESRASAEDSAMREAMRTWPSEPEAEQAVKVLTKLSPLGLSLLVRAANLEYRQRGTGSRVGMSASENPPPWTKELIDAGLMMVWEDRFRLTPEGVSLIRILPFGMPRESKPDWWDEVLKPLWAQPEGE